MYFGFTQFAMSTRHLIIKLRVLLLLLPSVGGVGAWMSRCDIRALAAGAAAAAAAAAGRARARARPLCQPTPPTQNIDETHVFALDFTNQHLSTG